jgi:hypothetical protein
MTDDQSSKSESSASPAKRARRSRRGGRGRRRKPTAVSPQTATGPQSIAEESPVTSTAEFTDEREAADAPMPDSPIDEARREAADESIVEQHEPYEPAREPAPRLQPERRERHDFKPAQPAAIADAIEEVNHIIVSLRQVLDEMEEILETLELAEVQKTADEREIQSLHIALRQFERRGGEREPRQEHLGHHSHTPQRHDPRRGRR